MPKFNPGQSGNPRGRPPGAPDRRTRLRALLEPHAEALIARAVELALAGDVQALRLCLERIIPPLKSQPEPAAIPVLAGDSLADTGRAIIQAMAAGEIPPDMAAQLINGLLAQSRLEEFTELEERLTQLEQSLASEPRTH